MGRGWWAPVTVLVLVIAAGAAQAQKATAVLEDPEGDTVGPSPAAAVGFIDLIRAEVTATAEGLLVGLTVASLQTDAAGPLGWELRLGIEYRDVSFDVVLETSSSATGNVEPAQQLLVGDIEGHLIRLGDDVELATFPVEADPSSRAFRVLVPWGAIETPGKTSAVAGDAIGLRSAGGAWSPLILGTPHNPWFLDELNAATTRDDAAWPEASAVAWATNAVGSIPPAASEPEGPESDVGGKDAPLANWLPAFALSAALAWRRRQ